MSDFDQLVATYRQTCMACPTQYEGTLTDGRTFYFRYRGGWATLGFGLDRWGAATDPSAAGLQYGDYLDGFLSGDEEFKELFMRLAVMRASRVGEAP